MLSFLFSDANFYYSVAIGFVIVFFLVELIGMVLGVSLMSFLDDLSPIEVDASVEAGGASGLLNWLCLDRLPLMIWVTLCLSSFGLSGYAMNYAAQQMIGGHLANVISIPIAIVIALLITGRVGGVLARMMPKNETTAIDMTAFEGSVATITVGTARKHSPAESKVIDKFEQAHYFMVEPIDDDTFHQGDKVILVKKGPRSWFATRYS